MTDLPAQRIYNLQTRTNQLRFGKVVDKLQRARACLLQRLNHFGGRNSYLRGQHWLPLTGAKVEHPKRARLTQSLSQEIVERFCQRRVRKYTFLESRVRQLAHHRNLKHGHQLTTFDTKHSAA